MADHWSYLLLCCVCLCGCIFIITAFSDTVNLLVYFSSMMVTHLTSPGHSILHPAGMPSTNTGNFPQPLVRLARQLLGAPPEGDT